MKRTLSLCLIAAAAFALFGRATCQRGPAKVVPEQAMRIEDFVYYHNVGITWGDGKYYTVNGGNDGYGMINVYDNRGELLESFDVEIDGRAIFYHPDEEMLYVKNYGYDIYAVDPDDGEWDIDLPDGLGEENSSAAWSPDGDVIYELGAEGAVTVYESFLGLEQESFELTRWGDEHGYSRALAASEKYLFTWDQGGVVYVHGLDGSYVTRFELPRDGFGFSLSWANGMLWIADDADGADEGAEGYWYGYRLRGLR